MVSSSREISSKMEKLNDKLQPMVSIYEAVRWICKRDQNAWDGDEFMEPIDDFLSMVNVAWIKPDDQDELRALIEGRSSPPPAKRSEGQAPPYVPDLCLNECIDKAFAEHGGACLPTYESVENATAWIEKAIRRGVLNCSGILVLYPDGLIWPNFTCARQELSALELHDFSFDWSTGLTGMQYDQARQCHYRYAQVAFASAPLLEDWPAPKPIRKKPVAAAVLKRQYERYVKNWPSDRPPPRREDDHAAMQAALPDNSVSHGQVRALRKELAPENWKKSGAAANRILDGD